MTRGERIRKAREAHGMTQAELARMVGISQQAIFKIEMGRTETSRHLSRICSALGIGVEPTASVQSEPDDAPGQGDAPFIRSDAPIVMSEAGPLEVMLEEMRFHHTIARNDPDLQRAAGHLHQAYRVAKETAPYAYLKHSTPPPKQEAEPAVDRGPPVSELEVERRLAFVLELGARGLLKGDDGEQTEATGKPDNDVIG